VTSRDEPVSLRILIISQFYPPGWGGQQQHVQNLSRALARRGHRVSVAILEPPADRLPLDDPGVEIHHLRTSVQRVDRLFSSPLRFAPPLPDPEAMAGLRRIIRTERPDVIHAHDWLSRSVVPNVARGERPLVVTLHDYSLVCAQKRLVHRRAPCSGPRAGKCLACAIGHYGRVKGPSAAVGNWVGSRAEQRAASMYIAVSQAVADGNRLEHRGLPFRVIPNFVADDIGTLPEGDGPALARLPERGFLLFVGDVAHDKGVETLFDAYRMLVDPPPLVLLGHRLLSLENMPRGVLSLGVASPATVMAAWRRSLAGVVPSIYPDPCPTVVMEAMAAGRPLVAARNGGIPDLIDDGRTGLLVPHSDPAALARALQRLLTSPDLRRRMSDAARLTFQRFTATSVVPRIEQVYVETLSA
jgi:glycosyltransferase involved in cell wall biosynthesis